MKTLIGFLVAIATLWAANPCRAGEAYQINWSTVDGGGSRGTDGTYTLTGTAGQPDAADGSDGVYRLLGGFHEAEPAAYDGRPFGDFDDSQCTDLTDFLFLLDNWEMDLEGTPVGIPDFLALLDYWMTGAGCP